MVQSFSQQKDRLEGLKENGKKCAEKKFFDAKSCFVLVNGPIEASDEEKKEWQEEHKSELDASKPQPKPSTTSAPAAAAAPK